jgi:hypothetical protein
MQAELSPVPAQPRPLWNLISLAAPIIAGVAFAVLRPQHGSPIIGEFGAFMFGAVLSSPLGVLAAVVALIRGERKWWVCAFGLLVNLPLFVLLLIFTGAFGPL